MREQRDQFASRPPSLGAGGPCRAAARDGGGDLAVAALDEKRIVIEAGAEDKKVIVRFSDNGPGFTDLDRIFDPFFTTKSPGKGTGLGLSICYGIIKEHAGDIAAYNLHPNGACIAIELPAAGAPAGQMSKTLSTLSS